MHALSAVAARTDRDRLLTCLECAQVNGMRILPRVFQPPSVALFTTQIYVAGGCLIVRAVAEKQTSGVLVTTNSRSAMSSGVWQPVAGPAKSDVLT